MDDDEATLWGSAFQILGRHESLPPLNRWDKTWINEALGDKQLTKYNCEYK